MLAVTRVLDATRDVRAISDWQGTHRATRTYRRNKARDERKKMKMRSRWLCGKKYYVGDDDNVRCTNRDSLSARMWTRLCACGWTGLETTKSDAAYGTYPVGVRGPTDEPTPIPHNAMTLVAGAAASLFQILIDSGCRRSVVGRK